MNLARGGAIALAAGVGILLAKAVELENKFRSFNVVLKGFGNEQLTTAENLEVMERNLRKIGLAADEASQGLQKVIRTPGVNPAAAERIVRTGAGLGVLTGEGTEAATGRLAQLVADTDVEGLIKLGVQLTAISGPQAKFIRDLKETKGSVVATDEALGLVANHLRDTYANSLSVFAKAMRDLSTAFSEFLRDAAVTQFIQEGLARIKTTLDEIRAILNLVNDVQARFSRTGDQATQKALEAQKELNAALAQRDREAGGSPPAAGTERFSLNGLSANTEALQRLSTVLGEASKTLPEGFRVEATSMTRPGSSGQHGTGSAIDVRIVGLSGSLANKGPIGSDPGLYKDLAIAAFEANQRLFPGTPLTWGGRFETRAGSGMLDWMHFDTAPDRGRFGPPLSELAAQARQATTTAATMPDGSATSAVALRDQTNLLEKQTREYEKLNKAVSLYGLEQVREEARLRGLIEAEAQGIKGKDALTFAENAANQAVRQRVIELEKEAANQEQATQGTIKAIANANSAADAYRLLAESQAELRVKTGQATDVAGEQRRILEEGAAAAVLAGKQQVLAATPQIEAAERVAEAAKQGAVAQREAQRQQEAAARTQDAVAKAEASRNTTLIDQARALNDAALAEIRRSDAAKVSLANTERIRSEQESQQILSLQVQLQGQTTEQINNQVNLLRTKIELDKQGESSTQAQKDAVLAAVNATGQWTQKLADAQREQQRLEDGVRSIVSTIGNELTRSIEDAFSGKKVEDWGTRIKRMLGSLVSQISDALFIKPLLGSIVGALGFSNVASSFGTFGGGGLLGSLFGGSSSTSSPVLTGTVGGQPATFSLSNLSSGLSIGKTLFGDSLFGGSGSGGGFFSNIGSSLGFASSQPVSSVFGIEASTLNSLGLSGNVTVPGSLFGSTTLGGALGSIGAGFGAGSLLNSLLGGNKLFGSIGSGIGSIAGTLLPSLFGFSLGPLGGILGGALGGLLGLFGNNKPRNQSAGGDIDFTTGKITGTFTGGNREIDQATLGLVKDVSSFTKDLLKISGGTLSGQALIQGGVNTGFTVDSTLPGYEGRFNLGKDATKALEVIELALSRSLTDISETMKTVINSVTDPADLRDAIEFAGVYDELKTAFDGAFSAIDTDTKKLGPYGQALDQIADTYDELTEKTKQYGLALEPVTAAYDETIKRLNEDFDLYLGKQENNTEFLVDALNAHQQAVLNWNDAVKLGLDDSTNRLRISNIEVASLSLAFSGLDLSQLEKAVEAFADTAPGVSDFAQALIDAGEYLPSAIEQLTLAITDPVTLALEKEELAGKERVRIAQATGDDIIAINKYNQLALDEIWKQATQTLTALQDDLLSGSSSGMTIADQIEAANDNFTKELELIRAGNLSGIDTLAGIAADLIQLSEEGYGNAPRTSTIRESILDAIDEVLALQGFAAGTMRTPPGTILVGEQGPELISQPGGLRVWSNPDTEQILSMTRRGRAFADGTLSPLPVMAPANADDGALLAEVRALRAELAKLQGTGNEISRTGALELKDEIKGLRADMRKNPRYQAERRQVA